MYQDEINKYIKKHTIFSSRELQDKIGLSDKQKAVLNTELTRFEKKGVIIRIAHGIYAVPIVSCFGVTPPNENAIANKIYLEKESGYASGPTFLNQIGISTWMPQKTFIKSNAYKKEIGLKSFVVEAPKTIINKNNYRYLQLLDAIEDLQKFAVDNENPLKLLYEYILANELDTTKLLIIANKFYKPAVQKTLFEMMGKYYDVA